MSVARLSAVPISSHITIAPPASTRSGYCWLNQAATTTSSYSITHRTCPVSIAAPHRVFSIVVSSSSASILPQMLHLVATKKKICLSPPRICFPPFSPHCNALEPHQTLGPTQVFRTINTTYQRRLRNFQILKQPLQGTNAQATTRTPPTSLRGNK